jgi:AraC family transcriptional regulator
MNNREQIEAMKRVQCHIESHLKKTITLKSLSNIAGYSPSHTERLFKEVTGKNLFEYIRVMRLTDAAKSLRSDQNQKIIDISLDYLFDSHEGFTRAFSKEFGISPKRYQKHPIPVPYFISYDVLGRYLFKHRKEVKEMVSKTVFVQVVERPKRKVIIKRGIKATEYFEYCEEVGCDVWGILESIPNALYEPAGFWLPKTMIPKGTSEYVQGVEISIDDQTLAPEGFEIITLEPSLMMIFQGEPYKDEDFMDEIPIVQEHIDKFNPKLYGYQWDDKQPRFQLSPLGYRGYIEAKPVKKI